MFVLLYRMNGVSTLQYPMTSTAPGPRPGALNCCGTSPIGQRCHGKHGKSDVFELHTSAICEHRLVVLPVVKPAASSISMYMLMTEELEMELGPRVGKTIGNTRDALIKQVGGPHSPSRQLRLQQHFWIRLQQPGAQLVLLTVVY